MYYLTDENNRIVDEDSIYETGNGYTYCFSNFFNGTKVYNSYDEAKLALKILERMNKKSKFNFKFKINKSPYSEMCKQTTINYPFKFIHKE
ncbi:MAG: hypothetical protein ACOCUI_00270 [bacterium]